jgi:hypothetical protein
VVLFAQCIQRAGRMIVVHPASKLTLSRLTPEQRVGFDNANLRLAERSEASRQRTQFVVYYGAVTSA